MGAVRRAKSTAAGGAVIMVCFTRQAVAKSSLVPNLDPSSECDEPEHAVCVLTYSCHSFLACHLQTLGQTECTQSLSLSLTLSLTPSAMILPPKQTNSGADHLVLPQQGELGRQARQGRLTHCQHALRCVCEREMKGVY